VPIFANFDDSILYNIFVGNLNIQIHIIYNTDAVPPVSRRLITEPRIPFWVHIIHDCRWHTRVCKYTVYLSVIVTYHKIFRIYQNIYCNLVVYSYLKFLLSFQFRITAAVRDIHILLLCLCVVYLLHIEFTLFVVYARS